MKSYDEIIGIDPGTSHTGVVGLGADCKIRFKGFLENKELLQIVRKGEYDGRHVFIEGIASFGMPVGKEVFETCYFIGRLQEAMLCAHVSILNRIQIKMHHCHTARAKDANVRQALIDRLGKPGTKKSPGPTYGIVKHLWSALAVALMGFDIENEKNEEAKH